MRNDQLNEIIKILKSNNKATWIGALVSLVALVIALIALLK